MNRTPPKLVLSAFGWLLRIDTYGLALHATDRWAADQAADGTTDPDEHDCWHDHADGPCDDESYGFREDDLEALFVRLYRGEIEPGAALAEFVAGVRAEPGDDQ